MNYNIEELLKIAEAISNGEIPEYQHNECFTSGAFDLLLVNVHDSSAYDLLQELCNKFISISSQNCNMKGYYLLLSQLAAKTNTTEMPHGMDIIISKNTELSHELQQWYRYYG